MALVTFGGGVAMMRGRLGGTVFSHNRGGNYARNFVKPTNPSSPGQVIVRQLMTFLVNKWNNILTAAQRTVWDTYGANVAFTNKVGDTIYLTGQQHLIRSNIPRLRAGATLLLDGPVIFDLGQWTQPTIATGGGAPNAIDVVFDVGDAWVGDDNAHMIFTFSREQNPTINYFKGPFQYGDNIEGDSAAPPASPQVLSGPFTYSTGNKVFCQVRVSQADGRLSGPVFVSAISAP